MYVLVGDSRGNRLPGAAAAPNALRRGEGDTYVTAGQRE